MPPVCYVLLNLSECHLSKHAGGPISATVLQGWITAIATGLLAIFAFVTAILAYRAFRKQSKEVSILVKQSNREADERRKAQAKGVFIGVPPRSVRLVQPYAKNASDYPVFDAQFWYSGPSRLSGPDDLGIIMPGPVGLNGRQMSYDDALEHAILTFRDAEGVRWIRMPGGVLKEQTLDTPERSVLAELETPSPVPAPAQKPERRSRPWRRPDQTSRAQEETTGEEPAGQEAGDPTNPAAQDP